VVVTAVLTPRSGIQQPQFIRIALAAGQRREVQHLVRGQRPRAPECRGQRLQHTLFRTALQRQTEQARRIGTRIIQPAMVRRFLWREAAVARDLLRVASIERLLPNLPDSGAVGRKIDTLAVEAEARQHFIGWLMRQLPGAAAR